MILQVYKPYGEPESNFQWPQSDLWFSMAIGQKLWFFSQATKETRQPWVIWPRVGFSLKSQLWSWLEVFISIAFYPVQPCYQYTKTNTCCFSGQILLKPLAPSLCLFSKTTWGRTENLILIFLVVTVNKEKAHQSSMNHALDQYGLI